MVCIVWYMAGDWSYYRDAQLDLYSATVSSYEQQKISESKC